ncbi:aminoglycoside 3-N-acetyltransferase [Evansella vedderi]|uniref:Aminoglycoside N(3)-acetyltransferase n=1 Tax=Evansella vedderi TaxID=38282 RepID=A0ABU0A186_9BACI|nr:AAC(3) family N-acetyltransferase [Evansella vedderi]MDQ0257251.1 aminoglycoside 3-N-acetyltransferase [Evansella vedderi]
MSNEGKTVEKLATPNTRNTIAKQLRELGLKKGDSIIVHSSLSSLGWVSGGAVAVIQGLMDVISEEGTIVMPTHSGDLSDPSLWEAPPVPKEWWQTIRDTMPPFDPVITPTRGMGKIVEVFRTYPAVTRSNHPQVSFAAWGKNAERWMKEHSLNNGLGVGSPLQHLYDNHALVLLLGVGFDNNTSFHLAEYLLPEPIMETTYAPVMINGERSWHSMEDVVHYEDWFEELGSDFEKSYTVQRGSIGAAEARLFSVKEAVDYATEWLSEKKDQ